MRGESEHFVVYADTNARTLQRYVQKIERFDGLLRRYYPITVDYKIPKLEIYLADGLRDMRQAWPGVSRSIGGFYSPSSGRIFAVVNTASDMGDSVLFHEYAHHFMFQMASAAYPAWFVEGFAEYYATADVRAGHLEIGRFDKGRMLSLTQPSNSWPPLEDVLSWRVSESGRFRGADYYAFSWALTHYLLSDPGRTRALGRYLSAVAEGASPTEALQTSLDRTPAQLQSDLRRYLSGPLQVLSPQIELPDAEVTVTRMSDAAQHLIWYDLRLDRTSPLDEANEAEAEDEQDKDDANKIRERQLERQTLIAESLAAANRYPDDPLAIRVKARAQRLSGDLHGSLTSLQPLVDESSTDAAALRIAALAELELARDEVEAREAAKRRRSAQTYLAQALDVDPLDFRIYLALDDLRRNQPGYPNNNDLSVMEVATTLAPQSFDGRMRYAAMLLATSQREKAIAMLTPVANSPHESGARSQARAMLIQARNAPGSAPLVESRASDEVRE